MFENRTMPVELSLSVVTVTVLGLKNFFHWIILVKSILAIRGHQTTSQSASLPRVWNLHPAHAEAEPCPLEPQGKRFWCQTCVSVSSTRLLPFWPQSPPVSLASFPICHISEWKMHSLLLARRIQGKSYLHTFLPLSGI